MRPIFAKKVFLVQNRKNKRHHRIHYIQIRLATKFQLIQEILLFGPILTKKDTPALKKEKANITIKFSIFELV